MPIRKTWSSRSSSMPTPSGWRFERRRAGREGVRPFTAGLKSRSRLKPAGYPAGFSRLRDFRPAVNGRTPSRPARRRSNLHPLGVGMELDRLLQVFLIGITNGALLALVALGYT